jgi:dTDP-4-amino-4,6-dideoxygalactose transaminase
MSGAQKLASGTQKLAIDGGTPVRDVTRTPWPVWPISDATEEQALLEVLRSGAWWGVEGDQGKRFEQEFAAYQAAQFGLVCTNGTAALEIALRALGIGCGDEVIVPPYTFVATASAVLTVGASPVFVDVLPDTLNIDPAQIEAAITPRTRAIIPVHIAGRPADMDAVPAIAAHHHLAVIEDAAQAHGAAWRGTPVGALGDFGTFSFQASKNLNSGEGGMILTNNEALADAAWSVINVGRLRGGHRYAHQILGGNFRMTEFQSAILRTQLRRLPEQTARRTANARYLCELLSTIPGISLPFDDPRITTHAYHLFTFRVDLDSLRGRAYPEFIAALNAEGIPCSDGYVPLYREGLFTRKSQREGRWCQAGPFVDYTKLHLPVCEQICGDTLWLPQTLLLAERRDMEEIAAAVTKILASR